MKRKDCENTATTRGGPGLASVKRAGFAALLAVSVGLCSDATAVAGQVRVWSSAVVVTDSIRLVDVAELRGFDANEELRLSQIVVTEAPTAGGSRLIHIEMIRSVLTAGGINMARVTFGGATQCEVSRPSQPVPARQTTPQHSAKSEALPVPAEANPERSASATLEKAKDHTVRQAVQDYFDSEFSRYAGIAEVIFDRTDEQVLNLSGPAYDFKVRRKSGPPLGLCSLEIDVLSNGRSVQAIPLVVQVTMQRRVVVARRSINQGATIVPADVEAVSMSFTRLDQLGLDDASMAIGQRAKRFISAGATIEGDLLEAIPLVLRSQLVTLSSSAGGVRIVTTAKAGADGMLGETIKVRSADDKRLEYDAVVIGPGQVRVGGGQSAERNEARFAWSDKP